MPRLSVCHDCPSVCLIPHVQLSVCLVLPVLSVCPICLSCMSCPVMSVRNITMSTRCLPHYLTFFYETLLQCFSQ